MPFVMKERKGPPYLTGIITGPDENDQPPPPVPSIAAHFKRSSISTAAGSIIGSSIRGSSRAREARPDSIQSSVMTRGTKGGYVDILDVTFRPSDFKTRIKATGTRDYGEDVAERNLGVNGVDLNSPAVIGFYSLTGGGPLAFKSDGSAVDVHGNKYAVGSIPKNLTSQAKEKDEMSAKANQSLRNPRFPTRSTSLVIGEGRNGDISRRKSVHGNALVSSKHQPRRVSSPQPRVESQKKLRPLSMHPVLYPNNSGTDPCSGVDIPRSRPSTAGGTPPKTQVRSNMKTKRGAKSIRSHQYRDTEFEEESHRQKHSLSLALLTSKRQSRRYDDFDKESIDTGVSGDYASSRLSGRPASSAGSQDRPQSQRSHKVYQGQVRSIDPFHQSAQNARNRSIGISNLDDISEHIPNRRTSLSISSSTPSSALSGFLRPHTASTSIDLAPAKEKFQSKFNRGDMEPQDYSTTDDESQSRSKDGEGLLFKEGFGGLPGLFDSHMPAVPTWLQITPSAQTPHRQASKSRLAMTSLPTWDDFDSSSIADTTSILSGADTFDSEMGDRLDVKLAVRLRKEMKRRERTSARSKALQRKSCLKQGLAIDIDSEA